jgi:hypothetical protein
MSKNFLNCAITSLPANLYSQLTKVTQIENEFQGNVTLHTLPATLFSNCIGLTSLISCFYNAGITSLPDGLFANNLKLTSLYYTFFVSSSAQANAQIADGGIPSTLFANNTKLSNVSSMLEGQSQITTLPAGLFANCHGLTNISRMLSSTRGLQSLPAGLFSEQAQIDSANGFINYSSIPTIPSDLLAQATPYCDVGQFARGSGLTSIPEGLFDKITNVSGVSAPFYGCASLTSIPETLFDKMTELTYTNEYFSGCSSLTTIPSKLFSKNKKINSFNNTFVYCAALTGNTPVTDEGYKFWERQGKPGYPSSVSGYACFYSATGLSDYDQIPAAWKQ